MSWINGYNPDWIVNRVDAEKLLSSWSKNWIGNSIEESFVGWYPPDDSWFADLPIILIIGGEQIEICWQKFDSLSITKNQLSRNKCISSGEEYPYKVNALPELAASIGKTILAVKLGMSSMTIEDITLPIINSVDFYLAGGFLSIYNALDENAVSSVPTKT